MLKQTAIPQHVAIIMDGNRRWAKQHLLPRQQGHRAGINAVRVALEQCLKHGVQILTLFVLSSENWRRPPQEIRVLSRLLLKSLQTELPALQAQGVRVSIIGERNRFNSALQAEMVAVEQATQHNTCLRLILAMSYGGRWDICQAIKQLICQVEQGSLPLEAITPELITQHLSTKDLPEPDLLIRSSGEQRLSNFLLWQLAYTELYFTETLWPDFNVHTFNAALQAYAQRSRRFGLLSRAVS